MNDLIIEYLEKSRCHQIEELGLVLPNKEFIHVEYTRRVSGGEIVKTSDIIGVWGLLSFQNEKIMKMFKQINERLNESGK